MLFAVVIVVSVLGLFGLPMIQKFISNGQCNRKHWKYSKIYGDCWSDMLQVKITTTTLEATSMIVNGIELTVAIFGILAAYKRWKRAVYLLSTVILIATILLMVLCGITGGSYAAYGTLGSTVNLNHDIEFQMMETFQDAFGNDFYKYQDAWKNTMRLGCCCGVNGYKDFFDVGFETNDVPEYCKCQKDYYDFVCNTNIDYDDRYCSAAPGTNITSKGCLSFVLDEIQYNRKTGFIVELSFISSVASLYFILSLMALSCAGCALKEHIESNLDPAPNDIAIVAKKCLADDDHLIGISEKEQIVG